MSKPAQLDLNFYVTTVCTPMPDGAVLVRAGRVKQTGTVNDAAQVLGVSRDLIYELIKAGDIVGFKPNKRAKNGKYRVNMASVHEHRRAQIEAAKRM